MRTGNAIRSSALFVSLALANGGTAVALAQSEPLVLEAEIALGNVHGRIDHLALDPGRERLFVAELGNDSVGVLDLKKRIVIRTLSGFQEPQGIAYEPSTDTVYVASAGDGSVHVLRAADLASVGTINLGADADNVRIDRSAQRVLVGYGSGALAVIDPVSRQKIVDIPLKAHPESFQLESTGPRIFVNVPDARQIAIVDRTTHRQTATWSTQRLRENFPLAIDEAHDRVLAAFRDPARLGVFDIADGAMLSTPDSCADADDVFVDAKRSLVYVSCGDGFIDVFSERNGGYARTAHLATAAGARTALFAPTLDRLLLAVRATAHESAAIWIFRPNP